MTSLFIGYHCLNGLMDYAAPITVEGQHLATIFYGQLLHEPPDEEFFRRQAHTYGFDEEAYLEALRRVPIVPKEQIDSIMTFYSHLGQVLATIGLERKLQLESANRAIREREERLQLVWETSEDGFWDWNVETGDIYVSRHWRDILGYSKGDCEVNIDTWKRLVHPEDIPAVTEVLAEHLQGHSAQYGAEFRMLTRSGEWKWIMGRGRVVARDNKGRALRMVGSCIDLTILKQAEAALLKSEEKFSRAFQINPDVMTIISLQEGRYVEVNDSFVKITGYEREEVIGRTVEELGLWVYPRERSRFLTLLLKQGSVRSFELEVKTKSGEIRTLCLSGEIMDINGRAHLLSSSRDITESKQMEAALRFSEECLSKAFNASPVLMAITQMEDGRYVNANEAFCSILGFERSEVAGISSIEIGFWANPADRDLVVEKLLQKQSIRDMEIRFCRKNGEQRLGLYSAEGIDVNGIPCILSVLADITDLRKMEAEMTRLDRLNLVGQMAASIGHEIRNPMTTVRGYLQMMRKNKNYQPELDYFDLMIEEIDRATP
jgi:PAS domain S-box-containing protein